MPSQPDRESPAGEEKAPDDVAVVIIGAVATVVAWLLARFTLGAWRWVVTGGSSNTVYSRTSLPCGQVTCTKKSRKGSRMGVSLLTRITALPLRLRTALKWSRESRKGRSTPVRAKTSAGANPTFRVSSCPFSTESSSISPLKFSFSAELVRISPRPRA